MARSDRSVSVRLRTKVIGLMAFGLFLTLFARLYTLQVLQAPSYSQAANQDSTRNIKVPAPRGLILSRNEQVLAGNKVVDVLGLSVYEASQHPKVEGRVAKLLGISLATVKADLRDSQYSPYEPTPIGTDISQSVALEVAQHASEYPGVTTNLETERTYPQGDTATHILGYVGPISPTLLQDKKYSKYAAGDQIGLTGVEQTYQSYLHGTPGSEEIAVNSAGQEVKVLKRTPAKAGGNLQLTISLPLEKEVESVLRSRIKALSGRTSTYTGIYSDKLTGAAVVEDVNNGSILAMASYPSYDPEEWVGGISDANYAKLTASSALDPLLNRAVSGAYTPGSIFKLATASAALQDGLITPSTIIDDTGKFVIPNCTGSFCSLHNAGYTALGPIALPVALAASDDVFFYTLGYRFFADPAKYGTTPIQNMAKEYGWGEPTGIALPNQSAGLVDSPALRKYLHEHYPKAYPYESWYVADQLEMAFGQGLTELSPIQVANAYATFANGGTRYVPRIADGIVSDSGKLEKYFPPKVAGHVTLSSTNYAAMLSGFEQDITNPVATGYPTFLGWPDSSYTLAGKTGTATVAGQNANSWMSVFGPEPHPKYVVVMVIKEGGFGDTGSGPGVRAIWQYLKDHPVSSETYHVSHLSAGSTKAVTTAKAATKTNQHG